ncbi:L-tyrosine/L-tryptophan isonitrile synthase family protein [Candidatus Roizmanbacteria bacterium]|nr:L-tyrosine/L-tryptophan isonitrile synthase family protein [Candidatus Roizmanbacteria bacterium]
MKKSSPYISLPYDFEIPLSETTFYHFEKKVVKDFNLKEFVGNNIAHLNWKDFEKEALKQKTIAEKILSIFTNEKLITGPLSNITDNKKKFLKLLNYFISQKKPVVFTITQIAFKIPNPLKVTRKTPDAGELAFLSQFHDIISLIERVYPPSAKIIIFGESYVFYKVVEISRNESHVYFNTIKKWLQKLGWDKEIILEDLTKLEKIVPKFTNEYQKNLKELQTGWKQKKPDIVNQIESVTQTLFLSLNVRKNPKKVLMELFDRTKVNKSQQTQLLQNKLEKKTIQQCFPYIAYHKSITTSNLATILHPNSLPLSCTGSPGKLGIYPIGKEAKLYPYHGVPVIGAKGTVSIRYEIDVKRHKNMEGYYIKNENTPFFFRTTMPTTRETEIISEPIDHLKK